MRAYGGRAPPGIKQGPGRGPADDGNGNNTTPKNEPFRRPRQAPSGLLQAAGLWAKTSAKGTRYLVGRLGGVKILVFQNPDRNGETEPTHHLFFAEGAVSPTGARRRAQRRKASSAGRAAPAAAQLPDDRVDDLWRDGLAP